MNSMASLAFVLPLTPGKTQEWRDWGEEILGPRRSEYEAFRSRLGLRTQRWYLQHPPKGIKRSYTWRGRISSARSRGQHI